MRVSERVCVCVCVCARALCGRGQAIARKCGILTAGDGPECVLTGDVFRQRVTDGDTILQVCSPPLFYTHVHYFTRMFTILQVYSPPHTHS